MSSVRLSQTLSCFFFSVSRWNQTIFGRQFSMIPSTKRCSSIFDLGPLTPKIYSQNFGSKNSNSFFLFFDRIKPLFGHQFSMTPSTKHCSSIFDLGPLTPKIYSPIFGLKSPITRLVWKIARLQMFVPTRGISGMADSMEPCKMLWGRPFFSMATKFGLGADI